MTKHAVPVLNPLEGLADLLRRGPSPAAMRALTGSQARASLLRVHFSDRRPVQLVYAQGGSQVLAELHGEAAAGEAESLRRSLAKGRRGLRATLDEGAIVADEAMGLVLRRPGLDARLPGLRLLHDGAMARAVVGQIEGRDPGPLDATLMAHRLGKRAVIRLRGVDGRTRYARLRTDKSRSGLTAFARHNALWEAFRDDPALGLPAPLGEDAALGLALFAELPGAPPVFAGLAGFRACNAIGAAIARLQSMPADDLPTHGGDKEAELLAVWFGRLEAVLPDRAGLLRPGIEDVRKALASSRMARVPCHRDLHEKQILIEGARAGLLDFDTLSLGDPAMDAGNLMAHLCLAGIASRHRRPAFESAIAQAVPRVPLRDLRLWRRAALLRLCMIYAFSDMPATHHAALVSEAMQPHD